VYQKREKGFTLIELLAVIVILAIIALIAVPVIMNIINKANKSAFKDTAYGVISAGELYFAERQLEPNGMLEDVTIKLPDATNTLGLKGDIPEGSITISKEGKTALAIQNGRYCITKGFDDTDVTVTEDYETCELAGSGNDTPKTLSILAKEATFTKVDGSAYDTPTVTVPECITNKTKCNAGTPVAVEVAPDVIYKFYVLNDDTAKNEVTLIMDRNLYAEGNTTEPDVTWLNASDYPNSNFKTEDGPTNALTVLKERTIGWINIPEYTYTLTNDADGQGGSYTYSDITGELVTNVRARLPRLEELTAAGLECTTASGSCKTWLYGNLENTGDNNTDGYWTSTVNSNSWYDVWVLYHNGSVDCACHIHDTDMCLADHHYYLKGLRPVITLTK